MELSCWLSNNSFVVEKVYVSALIFVISTIFPLINWKREKTEMKN
jgi:hypothetical protein